MAAGFGNFPDERAIEQAKKENQPLPPKTGSATPLHPEIPRTAF